ncbi:MAG: formylglycine-generating enzyme family protein [Phycisphaerae bacterium]|nr:formylglycine-generating enzyme family protein [Phycisphaerae bacterium]
MCTRRLMGLWTLTLGLVLWGTVAPTWATDGGRAVCKGDSNCDNVVSWRDIDFFVAAMNNNEWLWEQQFLPGVPTCSFSNNDVNEDGTVDWRDIDPLVALMNTSCPELLNMVLVPAGEFEMGDPWSEGDDDERPVHTVYLSPYYIGTHNVTNQEYAAALNWAWAQGELITVTDGVVYQYGSGTSYPYCDTFPEVSESRIHWDGATFTVTVGKEDHPMVQVSWYGSVAYCNWRSAIEGRELCYDLGTWTCDFDMDGYRLPTEAEWEKAAGWDPVQQRHFRFGEHTDGCGVGCLDGRRANYWASGDPFETGDSPWTTPVGFYNGALHYKVDFGWPGSETSYQTQNAQSYYGCYDMSGNVRQWCNDWYDSYYYDYSPYDNPPGPASGTLRVLRGGHWDDGPYDSRSAYRNRIGPDYRVHIYGFRCALGIP